MRKLFISGILALSSLFVSAQTISYSNSAVKTSLPNQYNSSTGAWCGSSCGGSALLSTDWITFDLGNNYTVTKISVSITSSFSFTLTQFDIQTSVDGVNFTPTNTIPTSVAGTYSPTVNIIGRYIRFTNCKASSAPYVTTFTFAANAFTGTAYTTIPTPTPNASFGNLFAASTTTGSLTVSGNAGITGVLTAPVISGNTAFNNNLSVTGTSTLTGAAILKNNLSVAGTSTLTGAVATGSLTSNGDVTINTTDAAALTLYNPSSTSHYIQFTEACCGSTIGSIIGLDGNQNMNLKNDLGNINITAFNTGNVNITTEANWGADVNIIGFDFKVTSGNIEARSMVVTNASPMPDYVFKPGYKLKSLAETEAYIKANGHLEDVPDDATVKEKGLNVADMNSTLLKKVEELTLLMINQNKRVEALEKENSALKAKMEEISNK
jgi:cytoskeletal protein CcmA (bactofilin family)